LQKNFSRSAETDKLPLGCAIWHKQYTTVTEKLPGRSMLLTVYWMLCYTH